MKGITVRGMLWWILSGKSADRVSGYRHADAVPSHRKNVPPFHEDGSRESADMELSVWVLLGIIRYLALLKESGNVGTKINGAGGRAKRMGKLRIQNIVAVLLPQVPSRTIIFTFAS
jgi:hypothetical protein